MRPASQRLNSGSERQRGWRSISTTRCQRSAMARRRQTARKGEEASTTGGHRQSLRQGQDDATGKCRTGMTPYTPMPQADRRAGRDGVDRRLPARAAAVPITDHRRPRRPCSPHLCRPSSPGHRHEKAPLAAPRPPALPAPFAGAAAGAAGRAEPRSREGENDSSMPLSVSTPSDAHRPQRVESSRSSARKADLPCRVGLKVR